MREKISKALKTRADAISRALTEYNAAAATLNPPRPHLSAFQVLRNVSLSEFDLLRDTRNDVRKLAWTNPSRREAAGLYFGILRAKEEIVRLDIEIKRLITFMIDEHVDYCKAISSTALFDPALARELSRRWTYHTKINESVVERLVKASRLPGFSGSLFPGQSLARDPALNTTCPETCPLPPWATGTLGLQQVVVEYQEDNDVDAEVPLELAGVDDDLMVEMMESLDVQEM